MKRVEFTVNIYHQHDHVEVDNVCDDLMDFVRGLNPRVVCDISVNIYQKPEVDEE